MSTEVVFQQMLVIFVLMGTGYLIFKKGWCSQASSKDLSSLITMVCNPAVMLSSAFDAATTVTRQDILITAVVAASLFAVLILLGMVIPVALRVPAGERKFYNLMTVYGNFGFVGIPVVSAVLGSSAVIYVTVFSFFFNVVFYTHGFFVLAPEQTGEKKEPVWKSLINVGTVASVITILIFWFQLPVPATVADSVSYMGRCTTFLSMVVLGGSLARMKLKDIFTIPKLYLFIAIRMVAVPIVTAFVLKNLVDNTMMIEASVLLVAMPFANLPLMLAQKNNMECEVLSKGIVLSTVLSLVTVTLVAVVMTM